MGLDVSWLPRGTYEAHVLAAHTGFAPGRYVAQIALWHRNAGASIKAADRTLEFDVGSQARVRSFAPVWQLESGPGTPSIESLSWKRGAADWFYKHFDHAARTTASYLLGDSPLLRGRVLDVGCGDGITDLGIALRYAPVELVGIDPFRGYERLPEIVRNAGLPPDVMPPNLRFLPASANEIPFGDDHFDVVVSWGSLEHIVGGYAKALEEIRRVLRPTGCSWCIRGFSIRMSAITSANSRSRAMSRMYTSSARANGCVKKCSRASPTAWTAAATSQRRPITGNGSPN